MNLNWIHRQILFFLCFFLIATSLSAQIRLAAIGGVHSSNLSESNSIPGYDTANGRYYSSKTGFTLGLLAEIPMGTHNLYFQPGILYSAKGNQYEKFYDSSLSQTDTLYDQHTLNLNYIEIPLYITWKFPLSKKNKENQFYVSAGPYFAFVYSASQSYQNRILPYNGSSYTFNTGTKDLPVGSSAGAYKTTDIGIGAKAGFEIGSVMLGVYFSQGLTNAYTAGYPSTFHNQVFGGSLGIWLNKLKKPSVIPIDTDHDGIPDTEDSCITIPGSPRWHGCPVPDSDHDGVNDELDSCPHVPGSPHYHGCPIPDTDQDGINDEEDSCKTVAGTVRYHGCPVPDSDQDGINDEADKCPDQPGPADNQGCPVVKQTVIQRAKMNAANITFKSNSTTITEKSNPALRDLADSLRANPDLHLTIEGHTDNMGDPAYNLSLSLERANAVRDALIRRGVPGEKIQVTGLGEAHPVASNSSADGRAENRRVVFIFQLKNR
jgi:OmpA-OmpF porin, OOP family